MGSPNFEWVAVKNHDIQNECNSEGWQQNLEYLKSKLGIDDFNTFVNETGIIEIGSINNQTSLNIILNIADQLEEDPGCALPYLQIVTQLFKAGIIVICEPSGNVQVTTINNFLENINNDD